MESSNENFNISSKESLLLDHDQRPTILEKPRFYKNRKLISSFFLILATLIAGSIILSRMSKKKESQLLDRYLSSSDPFFCRLQMFPDLCHESMSSIRNSNDSLKMNPCLIFSSSIKLSINQLRSLSGPGFSECGALVQDSLSRLNQSLMTLEVDSDVGALTYEEVESIKAWISTSVNNTLRCMDMLEEKGGDKGAVRRVEKARGYMVNSVELLDMRDSILFDFYNSLPMDLYNFDFGLYVLVY